MGVAHADALVGCSRPIARLTSLQGVVEFRITDSEAWRPAMLQQALCGGEEVRTLAFSRAQVLLHHEVPGGPVDGTYLQLNEHSALVLPVRADPWWVRLLNGAAHILSRTPHSLTVKTLFANASIEGTEFQVEASPRATNVTVFEGRVIVANDYGSVLLTDNETTVVEPAQPPRREIRLRPRDAVQWALYYPSIIDSRQMARGTASKQLEAAAHRYDSGDTSGGLTLLDQVQPAQRDTHYHVLRAAMLLSVGQVQPARASLDQALLRTPHDPNVLALQAIIALVQNDKLSARHLAAEAVTMGSHDPVPHVAMSYVQQSEFNLPAARASARIATELAPESDLGWARLAELQLILGETPAASTSAARARQLAPNSARSQSVTGFIALAQYDMPLAIAAFARAIARDPADPIARLGLGLATIRSGDLAAGRRDIEIAANLDPDNALIRSYLGKAYYEERRGEVAGVELTEAKVLDVNDPTPWLYDAIRKQTENRPVEASLDLQQSIVLNGNRAVYRSMLGLDRDEAARGATLGRLYRDLRFEQSALSQAWAANSADPTDPTAHRMLSDTYAGLPRRDVARVSELLQSQLLQPINVSPVQPQLAETNLFLLGGLGPAQTSLNEFSPLFMRNGMSLLASGLVGSHGLRGDEVVLTGINDKLSYSLGQLYYGFSGFRPNSDFDTHLYTAYTQYSLGERGNVQVELRHQDAVEGDLRELVDPLSATGGLDTLRRDSQRQSVRVGTHLRLTPGSDVLASFVYAGSRRVSTIAAPFPFSLEDFGLVGVPSDLQAQYPTSGTVDAVLQNRADTFTFELQHLWHGTRSSSVTGIGYTRRSEGRVDESGFSFNRPLPGSFVDDLQRYSGRSPQDSIDFVNFFVAKPRNHEDSINSMFNAYSYLTFQMSKHVDVIAGAELQSRIRESSMVEALTADTLRLNPKLGLIWTPRSDTRLRAAWLRRMTGPLATAQTIEPTHVAGFNQLFNDEIGTQFELYGFGVDHRMTSRLSAGLEVTWRKAQVPILEYPGIGFDGATSYARQWEQQHRGYVQWAPTDRLTVSGEYFFEAFDRSPEDLISSRKIIPDVITHRIPVALAWFHPNGIFARVTESFVLQDLGALTLTEDGRPPVSKSFWVTDFTLGYRLPKRRGLVTFGVNNLFDARTPFQEASPGLLYSITDRQDFAPPRYARERAFYVQITLAF